TVLSVATAPSAGSRCTKPVTRSADTQNGSRSSPSIVTGWERRTARTCCGAEGTINGGGESTGAGWIPASVRSNWSVVVIEASGSEATLDGGRRGGGRSI